MKLLAISGSLRAVSSNTSLLRAAQLVARPPLAIQFYDGLGSLPHFNPDLDVDPLPPAVVDLRAKIKAADGLLISSPEYARGVAGSMKNLLDWMVSDLDFSGKPVALFNASPRASHALAALRLTLETMAARIIDQASITLPLLSAPLDAQGIAADAELSRAIGDALDAFVKAVQG
ncbi:MAG: NADPH-dependent FMN reductase [Alphaproteobacteria bacterium]|nr:NADPH-dependent FMN reductase [Alphaproteobacteria bacterium]